MNLGLLKLHVILMNMTNTTLSNNTEIEYSVLELWFCCVMKNKSGDILFFRLP